MRFALVNALVTAFAALAGCSADQDPSPPPQEGPETEDPTIALPQNYTQDIHIGQGMDGVAQVAFESCSLQPWCFDYPLNAPTSGPIAVTVTLEWTLPGSDFDLVVEDEGGTIVDSAMTRGSHTEERMEIELTGTHRVVVVPYFVPNDDAVLTVGFARA